MTEKRSRGFTVISNNDLELANEKNIEPNDNVSYQTNPMYEKLLNFRNLQEQQKKKFSVEDLLRW